MLPPPERSSEPSKGWNRIGLIGASIGEYYQLPKKNNLLPIIFYKLSG